MIRIADNGPGARERYTLHVNDFPAAHVSVDVNGVNLHWAVYGPQPWPEAKTVLEGLLELSILADQLTVDPRHGKGKKQERTSREEILGVRYQTPTRAAEEDDGPNVARPVARRKVRAGQSRRVGRG